MGLYIYITPYERLAESLWLTADNIICYYLIIFTVLHREQILLSLAGERPVLICCLSGSLWPAERDKASLQSPPCGNETQHITCCLKMPSLSFQSLAYFNEMYTLALQCVWFCLDFILLNSTALFSSRGCGVLRGESYLPEETRTLLTF